MFSSSLLKFKKGFYHVRTFKLAMLGAMSAIGQPLSLLVKQSNLFKEIAIYDNLDTSGLAIELNSTVTDGEVTFHKKTETALKNASVVVIAGGVSYDGEVRHMPENILEMNCKLVYDYSNDCVKHMPNAIVCVVTNPVNTTFPVASQVFARVAKFFHHKVIGVNTLYSLRAGTCFFEKFGREQLVPILGGCTPETAVPVFSYGSPNHILPHENIKMLMESFKEYSVKNSTLSQSYASFIFLSSLMKSIKGIKGVVENAFIVNKDEDLPYFGTPVSLGRFGIESAFGVPKSATNYEKTLIEKARNILKDDISLGLDLYKKFLADFEKDEFILKYSYVLFFSKKSKISKKKDNRD